MMRKTKFHFIIPVWGKHYIDVFKNICVPLLLSKNNIFALEKKPILTLCIKKDEKDYFQCDNFEQLKRLVDLRYEYIDFFVENLNINSKFNRNLLIMTACHNLAIEQVKGKEIGHVFLMPDSIFFDGAFKNLERIVNNNPEKKVFLSYGVHSELESIKKVFEQHLIRYKNYNAIEINYKNFCQNVFKFLHAISLNSFVDSKNYFATGNMFFRDTEGVVLKMNIMHPIVVFLDENFFKIPEDGTVDNSSFIQRNISSIKELYYIEDTRDFFLCSVDTKEQKSAFYKNIGGRFNFIDNAFYLKEHIDEFFLKTSFLHEGKVYFYHNANLKRLIQKAKHYEKKVLSILKILKKTFKSNFNWQKLQLLILNEEKDKLISINEELKNFCSFFKEIIIKNKLEVPDLVTYKKDEKLKVIEKLKILFNILGEGERFISIVDEYKKKYKNKIKQFKRLMKIYNKIAIYSAGEDTQILMRLLNLNSDKIAVILDDSLSKQGTFINGVEVKSINDVDINSFECIIINSTLYSNEIYRKVKSMYPQLKIFK